MVRCPRFYGIGLLTTAAIVLSTVYYMRNDVEVTTNIKVSEEQRERRRAVALMTQPQPSPALHSSSSPSPDNPQGAVKVVMERERQSLPDDNAGLVFLRKFGRVKNLPTAEEMKNMTDREIQNIYHSYLDNTDFSCKRKLRMGNTGDGGWEVCDDFQYRPIKPCLVYSFGINFDFSFDDDVAKVYGCSVYAFDPSMKTSSYKRSDKVFFHNVGISGKQGNLGNSMTSSSVTKLWSLKTLTDIKAMLHHENTTLDLLKIDIEQSEWAALEDILLQGELNKVRQLLIEFHYDFRPEMVRRTLPMLQKLEALGLRRFHTHMNPSGSLSTTLLPVGRKNCYEVYFVNQHLARKLFPVSGEE